MRFTFIYCLIKMPAVSRETASFPPFLVFCYQEWRDEI